MTRTPKRTRSDLSPAPLAVSLRSLARLLDAGRSSVRRWLKQAGIQPISMTDGPKGRIRYRWRDMQAWLESREYVE